MREILRAFASSHSGLRVSDSFVSSDALRKKLLVAAASESLPEVFALNSSWVSQAPLAGQLADMGRLLASAGLNPQELFKETDFTRNVHNGVLRALPIYSTTGNSMLFVNGELLSQIGVKECPKMAQWDRFQAVSKEFVQRANPDGALEILAVDPFMSPGLVVHSSLCMGLGAPFISRDGRKSLLGGPVSLQVAKVLDDYVTDVYGYFGGYRALLEWRFRFAGQYQQPSFSSMPYERQLFALSGAGSLARYRRFMPIRNVSVLPVPGLERPHGGVSGQGWSLALSKSAESHAEAFEFVRFLCCEEAGAGRFACLYGFPSSLKASTDTDYYHDWGRVWDSVKDVAAMDTVYPASMEEEFLRYQFFLVPMRRLRGESMPAIIADIDLQFQAYLDGKYAS